MNNKVRIKTERGNEIKMELEYDTNTSKKIGIAQTEKKTHDEKQVFIKKIAALQKENQTTTLQLKKKWLNVIC